MSFLRKPLLEGCIVDSAHRAQHAVQAIAPVLKQCGQVTFHYPLPGSPLLTKAVDDNWGDEKPVNKII